MAAAAISSLGAILLLVSRRAKATTRRRTDPGRPRVTEPAPEQAASSGCWRRVAATSSSPRGGCGEVVWNACESCMPVRDCPGPLQGHNGGADDVLRGDRWLLRPSGGSSRSSTQEWLRTRCPPVYPEEDLGPAEERFLLFRPALGRPHDVPRTAAGTPGSGMRHAPFAVTPEGRRSTRLACFRAGLDEVQLTPEQDAQFWDYVTHAAQFMGEQPGVNFATAVTRAGARVTGEGMTGGIPAVPPHHRGPPCAGPPRPLLRLAAPGAAPDVRHRLRPPGSHGGRPRHAGGEQERSRGERARGSRPGPRGPGARFSTPPTTATRPRRPRPRRLSPRRPRPRRLRDRGCLRPRPRDRKQPRTPRRATRRPPTTRTSTPGPIPTPTRCPVAPTTGRTGPSTATTPAVCTRPRSRRARRRPPERPRLGRTHGGLTLPSWTGWS